MGQYEAQQHQPGDDEVCVSISSRGWGVYKPKLSPAFVEILRLHFDDTDFADKDAPDVQPITERQAEVLAKFVIKHWDKKVILFHCFAGMSRSRSAAAAVAEVMKSPQQFLVRSPTVYNAVKAALEKELNNDCNSR